MFITLVHYERVPVLHYGGTERVIEALAQGLLEAGHRVALLALKGDYDIPGVEFIALDHLAEQAKYPQASFSLIPEECDIVHFHLPIPQEQLDNLHIPYVCTLHGNEERLDRLPDNMIFLTRDHARRHQREHFVYNGLDAKDAPLNRRHPSQREYFAFLGRASLKRKGAHLAKRIARKLHTPLHIGGGRGISWFNSKYLGHLDNAQKYKLLAGAKGLLFPILWEEPFGLVLIEAMFCGTPVFAHRRGSVPEVLGQEGADGMFIIADGQDDLEKQIREFKYEFAPEKYRDYALKYFSYTAMAQGYEQKYQLVLAGEKLC